MPKRGTIRAAGAEKTLEGSLWAFFLFRRLVPFWRAVGGGGVGRPPPGGQSEVASPVMSVKVSLRQSA